MKNTKKKLMAAVAIAVVIMMGSSVFAIEYVYSMDKFEPINHTPKYLEITAAAPVSQVEVEAESLPAGYEVMVPDETPILNHQASVKAYMQNIYGQLDVAKTFGTDQDSFCVKVTGIDDGEEYQLIVVDTNGYELLDQVYTSNQSVTVRNISSSDKFYIYVRNNNDDPIDYVITIMSKDEL